MIRIMLLVTALSWSIALPVLAQSAATPPATEKPPAGAITEPPRLGYLITPRALPTTKDAKEYAEGWLLAAGLSSNAIGKVRTSGGIYVIDLHAKTGAKALSNQLLLRKLDGYAVLVYPASRIAEPAGDKSPPADPQKEAAIRNVMAGMSGMSGARGVYGGAADPNLKPTFSAEDYLIQTPAEAATAAKLWLFENAVKNVKVGVVREQGGVYVGQVIAKDSGKVRNQFVIRRADGFVAMVNPIKLPTEAKPGAPSAHGR